MNYQVYQAHADLTAPWRMAAQAALAVLAPFAPALSQSPTLRRLAAGYELLARAGLSHRRPAYNIATVRVENREVEVVETIAHATPFCSLLHFKKDIAAAQPRVLVVAPMSGHFATLLRGTLRTLLADHDVYLTDWHNARDVPLSDGSFDLEDFIGHLIGFLPLLGPGTHMLATCHPT